MNYKDNTPTETISRIKKILQKNNIETTTEVFCSLDSFYSSRIEIVNHDLKDLHLGTNGKGITEKLAIASGYAELMERIQNFALIWDYVDYVKLPQCEESNYKLNHIHKLPACNFPDNENVEVTFKQFMDSVNDIAPGYNFKEQVGQYKSILKINKIPFYSIKKRTTVMLPIDCMYFLSGTTGMCAGNSKEEALVQGICEVVERYSLYVIYKSQPVLPKIDISGFKNTNVFLNLKENAKKYDLFFEIKDCTFIEGVPVIGLLIIDKKNSRYTFRLGSDLDINIALERCVTEIFQGLSGKRNIFRDINLSDSLNLKEEYRKSLKNGNGHFPFSIFTSIEKQNYICESLKLLSNKDRLEYLIENITVKGYDIYIRNNSYLGFPTYHVYIPNVSDSPFQFDNLTTYITSLKNGQKQISLFNRLPSLRKSENEYEIKKAISLLEKKSVSYIDTFQYNMDMRRLLSTELVVGLLYFILGDFFNTIEYLKKYTYKNSSDLLINCLLTFLILRDKHQPKELIDDVLKKIYPTDIIKIVNKSVENNYNVFAYMKIANCFNCEKCTINSECRFKDVIEFLWQNIKSNKQNILKQADLLL